jgi:hypothetical protein
MPKPSSAVKPPLAAKPRPLQLIVKAKRKADGAAYGQIAQSAAKKQAAAGGDGRTGEPQNGSEAAADEEEEGNGALGGLLAYGSGSDSA